MLLLRRGEVNACATVSVHLAMLSPVLPPGFMAVLVAGWNMLYGIVSPAMASIMAVLILGAICWVIIGRR